MSESNKTGHYQRLRQRFLSGEPGSHSDAAVLELILTYSVGRRDVKSLVDALLLQFGNVSNVVAAPPRELMKIKGLGESSLALLKVIDRFQSSSSAPDNIERSPDVVPGGPQPSAEEVAEQPVVEPISNLASVRCFGHRKGADGRRKLQVCNGYLLEFEQLARVLHVLLELKGANKIPRASLRESTGLADRQLESLVSMGAALGLIQPGLQILSPVGMFVAQHDIFIEKKGTLEWCHYAAAGSQRNLIWFEVFNRLLLQNPGMTQKGWCEDLRSTLAGQYTDRTIGKHLHQEVRFLVDAYLERNFRKLEILHQTPEGLLYRRRYTDFEPLVLCAMIYDFAVEVRSQVLQVDEMAAAPSSPAMLFGVDVETFRSLIEGLHDRGFVRYETTHNLDQIRLKPTLSAAEFLSAHFEGRGLQDERSAKEDVPRG